MNIVNTFSCGVSRVAVIDDTGACDGGHTPDGTRVRACFGKGSYEVLDPLGFFTA